MTVTRWEYATVVWVDSAKKFLKSDPEYGLLSPKIKAEWEKHDWSYYWWKEQAYYIWLPGAKEAETRLGWTTGDEDTRTNTLDILNELGAEGWEVVTHLIRKSAMGPVLGRDTAGYPIETQLVLKRPMA